MSRNNKSNLIKKLKSMIKLSLKIIKYQKPLMIISLTLGQN